MRAFSYSIKRKGSGASRFAPEPRGHWYMCPSRKSYPRVAMMQSGQDWCGDDGPRSLDVSS
jgi:hypothetical protein